LQVGWRREEITRESHRSPTVGERERERERERCWSERVLKVRPYITNSDASDMFDWSQTYMTMNRHV
jgi:hypothetical protein